MANTKDEDLLSELRAVKRLLILQCLQSGVKQGQVASMLGVSEATMSRMLPKGLSRSLSRGGSAVSMDGSD